MSLRIDLKLLLEALSRMGNNLTSKSTPELNKHKGLKAIEEKIKTNGKAIVRISHVGSPVDAIEESRVIYHVQSPTGKIGKLIANDGMVEWDVAVECMADLDIKDGVAILRNLFG